MFVKSYLNFLKEFKIGAKHNFNILYFDSHYFIG